MVVTVIGLDIWFKFLLQLRVLELHVSEMKISTKVEICKAETLKFLLKS